MSHRTRTETINDLYVSTYAMAIGGLRDQVFNQYNSAFWKILRDKSGLMPMTGGEKIKFKLEVAKNEQLFWLKKGGQVTLQDYDILEEARYKWYRAAKPIVRFWADDQENNGPAELISIIKAKINNTFMSWEEDIDTQLNSANDEVGSVTADAPPGIQHLVSDDGTGTVGEIVAGTYTWWKNQFIDYDGTTDYVETVGSPSAADFLDTGFDAMREMLKLCRKKTSLIYTTWEVFKLLQDDLITYYQWYGDAKGSDLAALVNTRVFDGIPVMWANNCPAGHMYFLDMDSIKFVYDPAFYFKMGKWQEVIDQPYDMVAHTTLACSFCVSDRRNQGVIHGLPT